MSRFWSVPALSVLFALVVGCGGKKPEPVPADPVATKDPAKTPGTDPAKQGEPAKDPGGTKDPVAKDPVPAATNAAAAPDAGAAPAPEDAGSAPADAAMGGAPGGAGDGGSTAPGDPANPGGNDPAAAADAGGETTPGTFVQPGAIVRTPDPETPEGVIQRAIAAAMEPDEAKAWDQFQALLHTDEKLPNALYSRRTMNFPAMRRKVKLFLIEDEKKPIYQVDRVLEDGDTVRLFVHNKSSMPTPCEVRRDKDQQNKWRISTCSL